MVFIENYLKNCYVVNFKYFINWVTNIADFIAVVSVDYNSKFRFIAFIVVFVVSVVVERELVVIRRCLVVINFITI